MYRYEYVEAQAEGFFNSANHREIIDQYAERGFRFILPYLLVLVAMEV